MSSNKNLKLSVIIPVFNEEQNIAKVIQSVKNAPVRLDKEIVIIDDASTDKTKQILKEFANDKEVKILYHFKNKGKGSAIRTGLKEISGNIVLIQDADLEYSTSDYPAILEPLIKGEAKVVYGSRFLGKITGMKWTNLLANKILAKSVNLLYGSWITDEATAYKAFSTDVIKSISLKCQHFEFCPEVTAKIARKGIKIHEVPITYHGRKKNEGKKITAKDGFEALWTLLKYRFIK